MAKFDHLLEWFEVSFSGDDEPSVHDDKLNEDVLKMNISIARNTDDITIKGVYLLCSFDREFKNLIGIRQTPTEADLKLPAAVFRAKFRDDIIMPQFLMLKSMLCTYFLPRILLEYDKRGYPKEAFANFLDLFMKKSKLDNEYILTNLSIGTQDNMGDIFKSMSREVVKIVSDDSDEGMELRLYDKAQMFFRVPFLLLYLNWDNANASYFTEPRRYSAEDSITAH